MHHQIYPSQDNYITNKTSYADKNFGLDEILQIGVNTINVKSLAFTKTYEYEIPTYVNSRFDNFNGTFTGSFYCGDIVFATGSLIGTVSTFSSSYFSGSLTASVNGSPFTGSVVASGSISSSWISGVISGSVISSCEESFSTFTGTFVSASGVLSGYISGSEVKNQQNTITSAARYIDRAILKFDVSEISKSISNGSIPSNVKFSIKLKTYKAENLPIDYSIYAYPLSGSWIMGDGYYSDGGSAVGSSWYYKDFDGGESWYSPTSQSLNYNTNDYLNLSFYATESFKYGGGTWYYSGSNNQPLKCTQSFSYQSSDINMDITPIVASWISGSVPNNGIILMHSHETYSSASKVILKFYSRDSNTIYSPCLDVKWDDSVWSTGSVETGSSVVSYVSSGITSSVQSGSTFTISGGVNGVFSGSSFITTVRHYTTSSNENVDRYISTFSGSFSGSFIGSASYFNGWVSGSGVFTSSYFSGSVDGTSYELNYVGVSGSSVFGYATGSIVSDDGLSMVFGTIVSDRARFSGTVISASYLDDDYYLFGGIINGMGLAGNITGLPVIGTATGLLSISSSVVTGPCGNSFTASQATGSFLDGMFSGSHFTSYYVDYQFENAKLTGSWTSNALLGATINIPIPSGIEPFAYAYVVGTYVNGKALGSYTISSSTSASFRGQFISGNLIGGVLDAQLSGSVISSSYYYTSSIDTVTSSLSVLNINDPFSVVVKNVKEKYKFGDIAKIGVFSRKQHSLKNFVKSTQHTDYLSPACLPSSSYYSIKDHDTEENIIGFDNYTRISCEYPYGNYFYLNTTGLPQERIYRILIKVENSGSTYTFDDGYLFKVVR